MINYRSFYAQKFLSDGLNVFYWQELSSEAQAVARKQFDNIRMSEHVYNVSADNIIICRRKKELMDDWRDVWSVNRSKTA